MPAKVGINHVDLQENVFRLCIHGYNYPAGILLHEQTQISQSCL